MKIMFQSKNKSSIKFLLTNEQENFSLTFNTNVKMLVKEDDHKPRSKRSIPRTLTDLSAMSNITEMNSQ